ncbi:ABC transporter permease [Embleya sp. NBC_00896]|uniref:ABC transporter permease n=1 Tax=Embleya sp. NBC_00896 TaxID=2975961 RepID=UPI002F9166B9|nr:ABC transporter permease [Embleya sp. NBC_00896]
MFVALRDLVFARGRFALMIVTIVLLTALVGLVSGLTVGLGRANTSAIDELPADRLAFAAPAPGQGVSFADSSVDQGQWRRWAEQPGVRSAAPLGISMTRLGAGDRTAAAAAFGVEPGGPLAPGALVPGSVVLSRELADELGVRAGATLTVGTGTPFTVAAVVSGSSYSHAPVAWTTLADWQPLGSGSPREGPRATVIALDLDGTDRADLRAADHAAGTRSKTLDDARGAIGSFTAENGSLQLMRGFLFAISALVVGAFFTVWTIQRAADVAVLKALGAPTGYLLRDALAQALVVLLVGTGVGIGATALFGVVAPGGVPFVLDVTTTVYPAAVLILLGMVGAGLAIRRVTSVDPHTALGGNR